MCRGDLEVHEKIAHDILESICQEMPSGENVKC